MELPIAGPAYKHPSIDVNNQRCVNMFTMTAGSEGRGKTTLVPTSGTQLLINLGSDPIRCLGTVGEFVYAVCGSTVYKVTVNEETGTATSSSLGTISTSSGTPVYMAANPTQIMWADGSSESWIYTPGTGAFEKINTVDADFPGASQVVFLDGYFLVSEPSSGRFFASALNNGRSWNALDVATAESATDNLVCLAVVKGELWTLGEHSIEIWYNAGNASGMPLSPRSGLNMKIGCGASASAVLINDLLIWLDDRGYVVQSGVSPFIRDNNSGYDLQIISDEAITAQILSYARTDDAIAMGYNDRGHLMYQITFPTARKTWVYDYTTKSWHERNYYDSFSQSFQEHLGQFSTSFKSVKIMGGQRNGKLYLSKPNVYTDAGVTIHRIRTTGPNNTEFKLVGIDALEMRMATGVVASDSNPQIGLRYSNNGSHTWSFQLMRDMGLTGEYNKSIRWNRLGMGREWVFEFVITDPVDFAIIDASVEIGEVEV